MRNNKTIDHEYLSEFEAFGKSRPEEAAHFGDEITGALFRRVYDAVLSDEPAIDITVFADEIVASFREKRLCVTKTYYGQLLFVLNSMVAFFMRKRVHYYEELKGLRGDVERLIGQYTGELPGPGAADSLADTIMEHLAANDGVDPRYAAEHIAEQCPGVIAAEELEALMDAVYMLLDERGLAVYDIE